ncbi:MAG: sugar transferase [Rhodobacteraceae bacterium]|jgi:lipopolysaccharide/colanic/teichoic acid biosynthesis glycosyltransferase|nr:sugar transferase [Paracoccaceae bacterium]
MTPAKRLFDLCVALLLSVILLPVILLTALAILLLDGRPVLYVSERMKTATKGFRLIKFRTMKPAATDSGVSGGDKSARITRTGAFLRRSRLDEVPQLWNVLRGDISFVGPRPPLRQYVEAFPDVYARVLQSRPGITGLASVYFHAHEEHLLARCTSTAETDAVYRRACIPRKARLDLIYQARRNLCVDMGIMLKTVFRRLR